MKNQLPEMVLVIRSLHNPQALRYDYIPVLVGKEIATEQFELPDEKKNFHWRAARYASQDEINAYLKANPNDKKYLIPANPIVDEEIDEVEETEDKPKRGRKAKAVETNE